MRWPGRGNSRPDRPAESVIKKPIFRRPRAVPMKEGEMNLILIVAAMAISAMAIIADAAATCQS